MDDFSIYIKKHMVPIIGLIIFWVLVCFFLVGAIAETEVQVLNKIVPEKEMFPQLIKNISSVGSFFSVFALPGGGAALFKHILIFTLVYSAIVGVGMWKSRRKTEYSGREHGSSDWSRGGEQYKVLSRNNGLILAEENYLPLDKKGNLNILIVGGSGSGKSASFSIPNAHQLLGSYVFTDPKGEIYDKTAGYFRENGYSVKILNLVNPESSDSYNPLAHIRSELDVDIIASTIVRGQKSEKAGGAQDPYWDNMSELLLKALIYYLMAKRPPEECNLASCAEMVRAANNNGDNNLLADLINQLPYDHPARTNFKSVELASDKTYSSILSSLQSALGKFDSKDIADVTSTNTIDFEELANNKTALFVVSSDTHTAYDFLLTIFFSQLIQQLYDFADKAGGKLPVPMFFILDEFSNIGQIPDFDKKISTSRSRGISFSVILQNLDQLKAIYEKSYETIIGNCDTHVFLGSNSYTTVEYFSKELGEKTITHESKSSNRKNDRTRTGYSESEQIMARALMTPDELRRMDNDNCIIFAKGLKPIMAKKYWYYKKQNIVKDFDKLKLNHNDYDIGNRGEWRKYNPYNSDDSALDKEDTEIASLDDLFADDFATTDNEKPTTEAGTFAGFEPSTTDTPEQPVAPMDSPLDDDELDIEKQLEAKFDQLFGTGNNN